VQPEASVDYLGDGIRSLDEIIDWLSNFESSSGEGDKMSFKFHSNFAGQFQNFTEKHTWVRRNFGTVEENLVKGILPVTVSGTVALEALWLGYPAVVLGKPYFEGFHGITKIRSYDDFKKLLSGQLHLETVSKDRLIEDTVSFLQSCYNVDSSKSLVDYVKQL
jgi:capsule polysaccharide modification protein KpsS